MNAKKIWVISGTVILSLVVIISALLFANGYFNKALYIDGAPGSCLILEERYCSTGTVVWNEGSSAIAFNLPVGTPLFFPYQTGEVADWTGTFSGKKYPIYLSVKNAKANEPNKADEVLGMIFIPNTDILLPKGEVTAGTVIGKTTNTTLNAFGDYNLVVFAQGIRETKEIYMEMFGK